MPRTLVFRKGYLPVTDGHSLYYECWGNPRGIPVVFLHGGPGAGSSSPRYKRWFDPRQQMVIFFDQRGSARSKPFASIHENHTQALVDDITRLMDHLEVGKALLFGGSWGSTLALTYAIQNPKRVSAIFLRALFLGDRRAVDHYIRGGLRYHFPDKWDRFVSFVPPSKRKDPTAYYLKKMLSRNASERRKHCYEWARYEMSVVALKMTEAQVEKYIKELNYESLSTIEAHYMKNDCFMPKDYIIKNVRKLKDIPITLFHGRYDVICPPEQAWELHRKLPHMKLQFDIGGHLIPGAAEDRKFRREVRKLVQSINGSGAAKAPLGKRGRPSASPRTVSHWT